MHGKPIHKILVPTDFSAPSFKALNYACSLGLTYGSEIVIFHVNEAPVMLTNELAVSADYSGMEKEFMARFEQLRNDLLVKYPGIRCNYRYCVGVAAAEIISMSSKEGFDLIVMGTNGATGLTEVLIGSITQKVAANSECPVLAVPSDAPANKPFRIAFATNFDDHELQSIFLLTEIVRPFDTEITIVHIGDPANLKKENENFDYFRGQVMTNISYDKIDFKIVSGRDREAELENFIVINKMDWLAIAKRKRNFFDRLTSTSLSNKMTFHANIPILIFHTTNKSGTPLF